MAVGAGFAGASTRERPQDHRRMDSTGRLVGGIQLLGRSYVMNCAAQLVKGL